MKRRGEMWNKTRGDVLVVSNSSSSNSRIVVIVICSCLNFRWQHVYDKTIVMVVMLLFSSSGLFDLVFL